MSPQDKNFWKYVLKHLKWLFLNNQVWKIALPLYLILATIWLQIYYTEETMKKINSLELTVNQQAQGFDLMLRDVMGAYDEVIPQNPTFLNKAVDINHLAARQNLNWMFRYLFSHKPEIRDALERFHFYEQAIIDSLKKHKIPLDLRFVFLAESWAYPLTVSTAGAAGGWQFMPYTAIELKVEVNNDIDMRRDPWYMSSIFCDYISNLRKKSKSYDEALRAYNTGINRFLAAAASQSWVTKTWFVDVNDENNIYLFWILAWEWIYKEPLKFGIKVNFDFPPVQIQTIKVRIDTRYYKNELTFRKIAAAVECDMFLLRDLNLSFLKLNKKGERIIPGSKYQRYIIRLLKLPNGLKTSHLKNLKIKGIKFL